MLDMGWTEILIIGVVALIVVGPKDLPRMMRTVGQYAGKLRGMAREFQRSMDDAAREADLAEFKDIKNTLNDVKSVQSDAASAIRKGMSEMHRDIEKSTDLKSSIEDSDPKPATSMSTTAAPVDKPDPSAGMTKLEPTAADEDPGQIDTTFEPTPVPSADTKPKPADPAAAAPEPRTASGA